MSSTIKPVILSGGTGTRLWPLSTREQPKQFLEILGESLFSRTLDRLNGVTGVEAPVIVTGADQLARVISAAAARGSGIDRVIVEPMGRNTAPAVFAAALVVDPDDVMVVLPADHVVTDNAGFRRALDEAIEQARSGRLVTFGVRPDRAETGFGYIEQGDPVGAARRVVAFKEKPDADLAARYVVNGDHLWNSGMFVFTARAVIEEGRKHCPHIVAAVEASLPTDLAQEVRLGASFEAVESMSIDHAVMEHTENAVVVPIDVGWNDVGSYQALWGVMDADPEGNVSRGDVELFDVTGSFVYSTSRPVAVAGVSGIVVVETEDAVLVVPLERAQLVKQLVERRADRGPAD